MAEREEGSGRQHRARSHLHVALGAVIQQDEALGGPVEQGSSDGLWCRAPLSVNVPEQPQQGLEQHWEPAGHPARETAHPKASVSQGTAQPGAGLGPGQTWPRRKLRMGLGIGNGGTGQPRAQHRV